MSFTIRLTLGAVLILYGCWVLDALPLEKLEESQSTEKNVTNNLTKEITNQIPKTEDSNLLKLNSVVVINSTKLDPIIIDNKNEKEKKEIGGRSFDVKKYYSNAFQDRNNIYNLTLSKDTKKYINHDYEFEASSTHKDSLTEADFDHEIGESIELTTPKTPIFDHNYRVTVESFEPKSDNSEDSSHEESSEFTSKEHVNMDDMLNQTKSNSTNATLDYVNYKKLMRNDSSPINNSIHKDQVVESGTNLDFQSSFNKTEIIDEEDDDDDDEEDGNNNSIVKETSKTTETTTIQPVPLITTTMTITQNKIILKPKPSQSSILTNKIEQDKNQKLILTTTAKPDKGQEEVATNINTKTTPIDITKRGSIKFADYTKLPTTLKPKTTSIKNEELVQENQIVPVSVQAPQNHNEKDVTIAEPETSTTEKPEMGTEIIETTTTTIPTTMTVADTTTVAEDAYSTIVMETTTFQDVDISTTINTEASTETVTEINEVTTTTESMTSTMSDIGVNSEEINANITTESGARSSKAFQFKNAVTSSIDSMTTESLVTSTINLDEVTLPVTEETTTETETTTLLEETTTSFELTDQALLSRGIITPEAKTEAATLVPALEPLVETDRPENDTTDAEPDATSTTKLSTIESDKQDGGNGPNSGTIAAIVISTIGAVCLVLLAGLLVVMRKRQKRFNYGQRCTPVNLDDYSMDNISVQRNRRKSAARASKRSYGNPAFDDPVCLSHPLNFASLGMFANNADDMRAEYGEIPQITARTNELPEGCDTKNRYANVIPLPETRVFLTPIDGYANSDYINANYVTGPDNIKGYYIACQAPMENTVDDFWRMIWEQECKVVLMVTHHYENGIEKCVDYLPPSEVLDCHRIFGDYQVTLKKREVKDKYVISILQLKNMVSNSWREVTHFWYTGWPEKGVPNESNSMIAFLIEARSYMKSSSIDKKNGASLSNGARKSESSPVVVHCSPGTGRTGVVIACDIAIREYEKTRLVDVPKIVYKIRRDRASAVQTKEQYMFIYKVINFYATKLTGGA